MGRWECRLRVLPTWLGIHSPYIATYTGHVDRWTVRIAGAEGTPYAGETFLLSFHFPQDYPMASPEVRHICGWFIRRLVRRSSLWGRRL